MDAEPAHFFGEAVVVITRIDHNGRIALAIEEDVRHPFAHTGDTFIDPAGVQGLKYLLAAIHFAHFFFLKFGCLLGHLCSSFSFFRPDSLVRVSGIP